MEVGQDADDLFDQVWAHRSSNRLWLNSSAACRGSRVESRNALAEPLLHHFRGQGAGPACIGAGQHERAGQPRMPAEELEREPSAER